MGILQKYKDHLDQFIEEVQTEELLIIVSENSDLLVDANTNQLLEGKDSDGDFLREYESKEYAELKKFLNPRGVTDLKLTGDFHDAFETNTENFPVTIDSTDEKRNKLVDDYGKKIFGVPDRTLADIIEKNIRPPALKFYRNKVFRLRGY